MSTPIGPTFLLGLLMTKIPAREIVDVTKKVTEDRYQCKLKK
jgi:hypothetical protein